MLVMTAAVTTLALAWFGWRLFESQRAIDEQRAQRQLEGAAELIAAGIRARLAETGDRLSGWVTAPGAPAPRIDSAVVFATDGNRLQVMPPRALPFLPHAPSTDATPAVFAAIESIEFRDHQLGIAAERYRTLTTDRDPRVRAGALLRLGRTLRNAGDLAGALAAYRDLTAMTDVYAADLPADLLGLDGERSVFRALGDHQAEQRVSAQLLQDLDSGRWQITRGQADFYRDQFDAPRPDSWLLADALTESWYEDEGQLSAASRIVHNGDRPVIVVRRSHDQAVAFAVSFADTFVARIVPADVGWQLLDGGGQVLAGATLSNGSPVTRMIGDIDAPWTLRVGPADAHPVTNDPHDRTFLFALMLAVFAFLWSATYVMARALRREEHVTRLQSDFVAAVSHEFRSPLTTIRQMAEMLEMGRLPSEERRHTYYQVLAREAARLQRLVETLLTFGQMEAGAMQYRRTRTDVAALARSVVHDVEPQARAAGIHVETAGPESGPEITADAEALGVALRNLVENAIKYSPRGETVRVEWPPMDEAIAIRVIDHGPGIPPGERQTIFRKFVRGRAAAEANVKGTGVGLSMATQIVGAHGGEIRLESEVGSGSTFAIWLPYDTAKERA
jgi:signal transduction histidine kinase